MAFKRKVFNGGAFYFENMCGIAGYAGKDAGNMARIMLEAIRHRGPDGLSFYDNDAGDISLGHAHLKVTGDKVQPVVTENGALTYNGEIYNFERFLKGTSDTEALAREILKDGAEGFIKAAPLINGEYAFALYSNNEVLLARDPVGIKPLYYGNKDNCLAFASEKKALIKAGIKKIVSLTPGHIFYKGSEQSVVSLPRYTGSIKNEEKAMDTLESSLKSAISIRSHPEAAIAFSGGVDCALIAALAKDIPLCTVGLEGSYDIKAAKKAVKLMDAEERHHIYTIKEGDIEDALPRVVYAIESYDPVKVSIAVPVYLLAREARKEGIRVLISGQGSDELFGGYSRHEKACMEGNLVGSLSYDLENIAENNLLRDDAATMAHGVELRVPYLDIKVIEAAQNIDVSLKVHFNGKDYIRKYILRKIAEKYLPQEISCAPKKAIQYGTNVQKALIRIARDSGFKNDLAGYFKSLYEVVFEDGYNRRGC